MLKVGLTGGIGSGKTTVAKLFAKYQVPILDADAITHQLSQPHQAGYLAIVERFGPDILDNEQHINRQKLGALIFNDAESKQQLEAILHPMILEKIRRELAALEKTNTPYCIIDIPLIKEPNQFEFLDRVLVVDSPIALQISRIQQRDHIEKKIAVTIIEQQCDREQRLALADDTLTNDDSLETLARSVHELHNQYLHIKPINEP